MDTNVAILKYCQCRDCGWPVIHAFCDDIFRHFKDAKKWEWWLYCSNKGCKNHDGEGVRLTEDPPWLEKIRRNKQRKETVKRKKKEKK